MTHSSSGRTQLTISARPLAGQPRRNVSRYGVSGGEDEMEAGGLGEGAEVAVACNEGNAGVHTVLRYQGIGEASSATLREHLCAQRSGPLPKTGFDLEQWHIREADGEGWRKFWVAQEFGERDGRPKFD